MISFTAQVKAITGRTCQEELIELMEGAGLRELCPITVHFTHVEWILAVGLIHHCNDVRFDSANKRVEFGFNDDGFPLLIDLNSDRLEILQIEFGEVDSLGICVTDILDSIRNGRYKTFA